MAEEKKYNLIVFDSTHHALAGEELLEDRGYQISVVPVPPEISADCGIAIKFADEETEILTIMKKSEIEFAGCYKIIKEGLEKRISNLGKKK